MEDGIILEQSDGNHGELYPRSKEFVNEGIPYIAASSISSDGERIDFNLTKYLSMERAIQFRKGVAKNGDVLLAHNATVGPSVMLSMDYEFAILSTSLTLYRLDKEKMSPMFFLQAIRSGYFQKQLEVFMKQTTRSQVPILTQRNLQISYPINKVEQERIGEFLSNLDHLITLHQCKCQIDGCRFQSPLAITWEQRKLSEIATMHARIGWQNLRTSEFLDSGDYMLITGTDFIDGAVNFDTCHYVERERYEQDKHIQIRNGSILITKDGTLGKVAYIQGLTMPATLNAGVFNVEIKDENEVDNRYLFQYLKAPFLMDYVDKKATGGTIKHLNQNILVDFPVVLPHKAEQEKIGEYFLAIDHLITLHQCE